MSYWVVYWLYDSTCTKQAEHGFVGVTRVRRLYTRLNQHRRSRRFPRRFEYKILFTGTRERALRLEAKLRPTPRIGWNHNPGGFPDGRGSRGIPKSAAQRRKMRQAALKRYQDPSEHKKTSRTVKTGLKGIDRTGSNNAMYGRTHSEKTRKLISRRLRERQQSSSRV